MYAFPRRKNVRRRSTPRAALFDPSGDARCVGWWRADQNVVVDPQWSLVSNWNSLLPNAIPLAPQSGELALYLDGVSNGFPAIYCHYGTAKYVAAGLFKSGDLAATLTLVGRFPYLTGADMWLAYFSGASANSHGVGYRSGRFAIYANTGYAVSATPGLGDAPGVLTYRVSVTSDTVTTMLHKLSINGSPAASTSAGTQFLPSPSTSLMITDGPYALLGCGFHEIIVHNAALSDMEVVEMHTVLLGQYRGA